MGLDEDRPFKDGHLYDAKNKKVARFCQLFAASKQGVQRLEMFPIKNSKSNNNTIIPLVDCIKICPETQQTDPPSFHIVKKDIQWQFYCKSHDEMEGWVLACQTVAFSSESEEDNELYCSSNEGDIFPVTLESTEASERCNLQAGRYHLKVDAEDIKLLNEDKKMLLYWPYLFIRRFRRRLGKFAFEAGRKCKSGEGYFTFNAANIDQTIYNCVLTKMEVMKKQLKKSSTTPSSTAPSSPALSVDSVLQQRVSGMNARSRSPLPPSPTSDHPGLLTRTGSTPPPLPPLSTKPCPSKPPRKNLPPKKYEDVSEINEAWRHLGINEPFHLERSSSPSRKTPTISRGKVFKQPAKAPADYDRLQHFGTTRKQSPAYKHLDFPLTIPSTTPSPKEEVKSLPADIETARLADDSHAYGVIRKKLGNPLQNSRLPLDYAVVCIPHRV